MANTKIEYLKNLEPIPIENIISAVLVYGSNSKYGAVVDDAEVYMKESLSPVVFYDRTAQRMIVTSTEFMSGRFH